MQLSTAIKKARPTKTVNRNTRPLAQHSSNYYSFIVSRKIERFKHLLHFLNDFRLFGFAQLAETPIDSLRLSHQPSEVGRGKESQQKAERRSKREKACLDQSNLNFKRELTLLWLLSRSQTTLEPYFPYQLGAATR